MIHLVNQVFKLGRNNENIFLQLWGALNCSPSVKLNCRNRVVLIFYTRVVLFVPDATSTL